MLSQRHEELHRQEHFGGRSGRVLRTFFEHEITFGEFAGLGQRQSPSVSNLLHLLDCTSSGETNLPKSSCRFQDWL